MEEYRPPGGRELMGVATERAGREVESLKAWEEEGGGASGVKASEGSGRAREREGEMGAERESRESRVDPSEPVSITSSQHVPTCANTCTDQSGIREQHELVVNDN